MQVEPLINHISANLDKTACCRDDLGIKCSGEFVTDISFASKSLKGNIGTPLGNLRGLRTLDLSHNSLVGGFPKFLLDLPNLDEM